MVAAIVIVSPLIFPDALVDVRRSEIERLRFTFTLNGKREFVPREQVFPLFSVYSLLLLHKNK